MARIETPTPADVAAIARLFREDMTSLGIDAEIDRLEEVAEHAVEDATSDQPDCIIRVVRVDDFDEPVGVLLANFNYSLKFAGRSLWIEELYVTPDARRRGLGRQLVEELLDWAEDNEIAGIDLEAYQGNTPASILYRSLGFHRLGRERFYYRVGSQEYL